MAMQYKKVNTDPRWKETPQTTTEFFAQIYHISNEYNGRLETWFEGEMRRAGVQLDKTEIAIGAIDAPANMARLLFNGIDGGISALLMPKRPDFGMYGLKVTPWFDLFRKKTKLFRNTFLDAAKPEEKEAFDYIDRAMALRLKEMREFQNAHKANLLSSGLKAIAISVAEAGIVLAKVMLTAAKIGLVVGVGAAVMTASPSGYTCPRCGHSSLIPGYCPHCSA